MKVQYWTVVFCTYIDQFQTQHEYNNCMPGTVYEGLNYLSILNFNDATVEVGNWTSNSIPYFIMDAIT